MLNGPCFTPDCTSTLWLIMIYDDKGEVMRRFEANPMNRPKEPPKKVLKMEPSRYVSISANKWVSCSDTYKIYHTIKIIILGRFLRPKELLKLASYL